MRLDKSPRLICTPQGSREEDSISWSQCGKRCMRILSFFWRKRLSKEWSIQNNEIILPCNHSNIQRWVHNLLLYHFNQVLIDLYHLNLFIHLTISICNSRNTSFRNIPSDVIDFIYPLLGFQNPLGPALQTSLNPIFELCTLCSKAKQCYKGYLTCYSTIWM